MAKPLDSVPFSQVINILPGYSVLFRPMRIRSLIQGFVFGASLALLVAVSHAEQNYQVRKSDTLTGIAKTFECTVEELVAMNALSSANDIRAGQLLRIPGNTLEYIVRKRESLSDIADRFNSSVSQIVRVNGLANANRIYVGQRLKIPRVVAAPSSSPSQPQAMTTVLLPPTGPSSKPPPRHATPKEVMGVLRSPTAPSDWRPIPMPNASATVRQVPRLTPPPLPADIQAKMNAVKLRRSPWQYIVVHHSGTPTGNWKGMEHYHRNERGMENGLAYHFVIHNGASKVPDGQIHVGHRWTQQLDGGHMKTDPLNHKCIGICLVGNFEKSRPSWKQRDALNRLLLVLLKQTNLSTDRVKGHRDVNPVPTACPGKYLDLVQVVDLLNKYQQ